MKKILLFSAVALFAASCRKESDKISTVQTVSRPTITLPGGEFYSINTGGALPVVTGTAYDSVLKEAYPVSIVGTEALDNTTPGLYIINAKATNRYGYYSLTNVYVAVTDIPATVDISGNYKRTDVTTGDVSIVTQLARGLYYLDNLAGASRATRPDLLFPVLFVQSNDSTLLIPAQETAVGNVRVKDTLNRPDMAIYRHLPNDTNYKYAIISPSSVFGSAIRTFKKQ